MKTIKVLLVVLISFSFQKLFAQPGLLPTPYCMPLYNFCPCNQPGPSNMPGSFVNDFIHSVITSGANGNINNPNTGCNSQNFPSIGIRNYIFHQCQHNLSVSPGQAVTFSIQIGNDYAQGIAVFIDWNLDNIFQTPSEMVASTPGTIPGAGWANLTVNIPPAQPNGIYRMRIRCARLVNGSSIDPCVQYTYGEVEDYIVCVGNTSPVITATATSNSTLCAGNTLSLNVNYTSQCTPSFTWVGPNNYTTNNQNNTIANAQPIMSGNYTVMLNCGLCPITATTNVVIDANPTTANAGTNQCLCLVSSSTLNGNVPSVGTGTWTLISGSGLITNPNSANSGVTALGIGTNVFQWTISNGSCPPSTSTVAIIRGLNPSPSVAGPNQTLCIGSIATMSANVPAIGTGSWTLVSGMATIVTPTSASTQVTGLGTGTNVFMWTISGGCCSGPSSSSTVAIVINSVITVSVNSSANTICAGANVILNASGATNYTWMPCVNLNACTGNSVIGILPSTSQYSVFGSMGTCTDIAVVTISVVPAPTVTAVSSNTLICYGNSVTLTANGASSYTWLPGGTGSVIVDFPVMTTMYILTGSNGVCTATTSITQSVIVCAGIDSKKVELDGIKIYPNPFKDELKISCTKKIEIKIVDVAGKLVLQKEIERDTIINTQTLAKGIYLLHLSDGSVSKSIKVIKD